MIHLTESAEQLLHPITARFPDHGLRLTGLGNVCQGIQIQVTWQAHSEPDDREEIINHIRVWIASSLTRQLVSMTIGVEAGSGGPELVVTPQYPDCACSSSQDCHWHDLNTPATLRSM
ncbi:hypothetical protein [Celerinatantimonas sp. YJH-8]|uniref:hypothetical protein n=1 Tax=Celerinatantimonas sp. YJH-8 TaxID=3228714 RepID=UPI0038C312D8